MRILFIQAILFYNLIVLDANPIDTNQVDSSAEYGDKFQGDLILTPRQEESLKEPKRGGRTGTTNFALRWPKFQNGSVIVPYVFDSGFTDSQKEVIKSGMDEISANTCIQYVQRTTQSDYIKIINGNGCWSYVGKIGGEQQLSLSTNGCVYFGIAMHELIHSLGYLHMQQHWDRDTKIYINWGNIVSGKENNFIKVNQGDGWSNYNTAYDIYSIMHYGPYSFSKNGKPTIQAINYNDQKYIGQRYYLSNGDISRIKNMYEC